MNPNAPSLASQGAPDFRQPDDLVSADQKLELLEYWRSVTKRKWPILGLMIAAGIAAAAFAYSLTPIYKGTATLMIEAGRPRIVNFEDSYSPGQSREGFLTQVEVIKSRDVVERAVRAERLWEQPAYDGRLAPPGWRARLADLWGTPAPKAPWNEERLIAHAVLLSQLQMSVEPVGYSQLIRISFESPDPALAARMANAIAAAHIQTQLDVRIQAARQANTTLMQNLGELKQKLTDSERALQQYRESQGLVSLSGSTQTMASQQATAATQSLSAARSRRLELEGAYRQMSAVTNQDYTSVPWVMRDPAVQDAQRQANEAKRRLLELSQTLGSNNSKIIDAQAQVDSLEATLKRLSSAAADSLRREYQAAASTEQSLERDLSNVRNTVKDANRGEFQLATLEREVQSNRQLYDLFVTRSKETSLSGEVQAAFARIVEQAIAPGTPIKPVKERIIGLAIVAAALLGAAIGVLLDALNNTVKGADDAERRLRLPLLTALPVLAKHNHDQMAHLFLEEPNSHFAEAIRTARTGVMLSNIDKQHKTLLITSTVPGEGKTTLALNLALAHAQTRRTLIIDADMRRPQVAQRMGLSGTEKGLSNLVAGDVPAEQCIHRVPGTALAILPVGDLPPNPLELLLSQRFEQALTDLAKLYDVIVIDSPPVGLVSDALVLAPRVTSTVLVVRAMATAAPLARKSISRLQRAGASMLGVVLNGLDFEHAERYYGDYGSSAGATYGGYGGYGGYDGKAASGSAASKARMPLARPAEAKSNA